MTLSNFSRAAALLILSAAAIHPQSASNATRNVVFVMTDGLRWQEVFTGADPLLMNKENGAVADIEGLRRKYWRESPEERREALMPFLWSVMAKQGQLYGNRKRESDAFVTNGLNFSYPGYSEILCGFVDPGIKSNDKIPNPNVTVLEWLHNKPAFRGRVAAFGAWDTFPAIFNAGRAGFPVNAGYAPLTGIPATPQLEMLNRLKDELPRIWPGEPFDAITFHTAVEYLKARKPRVLFLSLGETDEWSHGGQYAHYLDAANRADAYLRALWQMLQSMPEYRGKTSLVFSTDHGRGEAPVEWKSHGQKVPDSKYIWMAFLGPDTRALGERSAAAPVTQNQIAATIAALLGEDYRRDVPRAAEPVADAVPAARR